MRTLPWLCLMTVGLAAGCAKTQTSNERTAGAGSATAATTTVVGRLVINDDATSTQIAAPGTQVALENGPTPVQSGDDGRFTMTIPAGSVAVTTSLTDGTLSWYAYGTVNGKTYGVEQHGITVTVGQQNDLHDVVLHWSADIKGVVEAGGAPLAGVTVQVPGTIFTTTTDASGAFDLSVPPATWTVQATKTGYHDYQGQPVTLSGKQVEDLGTITLQAQ